MRKKFLTILLSVFLFTGWIVSLRADSTREYDFSMQEAMADEALKHLGKHYLKNTCGGISRTTPKIWNGVKCATWERHHKEKRISCIGVRHFDCSGFIFFCANAVGFNIPRKDGHYGTCQIWYDKRVAPIPLNKIRKGTLVFKKSLKSHKIYHVGIYLGNKTVVECSGYSGWKRSKFTGVQCTQWGDWLARRKHYDVVAGNLRLPK